MDREHDCRCCCGNDPLTVQVLTLLLDIRMKLELHMSQESDALAALDAKVTELIDDVRAALAALEADRDNLGPEGQAALDALTAKVDAFGAEVGDADADGSVG